MVCCSLGNFLPLWNDYLLISHKSLRINVDSTHGLTRETIYDTGFTWDLVDDLNSYRSFHDDFWSTEGYLILLIHWDILRVSIR